MPILTLKEISDIIVAVEKDYRAMYNSKNVEERRTGFVGLVALKKIREMVIDTMKKKG